ncbi:protein MAIN-LIKE 1-like [Lotus japonicus]|uniref:protein MAIN-LIKE 1-like n=1 Tax=Lotus japonicus TaxID=34305 RepID=UPI0025890957|nr:protein MAIN-LIKE 1-like [Lotus japonicus]
MARTKHTQRVVGEASRPPHPPRDRSRTHASARRDRQGTQGVGEVEEGVLVNARHWGAEDGDGLQNENDNDNDYENENENDDDNENDNENEVEMGSEDGDEDGNSEQDGESEDGDETDGVWYPGGPYDLSLLPKFGQHIAHDVWKSYVRSDFKCRAPLKIHHHGKHFFPVKFFSDNVKTLVAAAGLGHLPYSCNGGSVDLSIVTAFVERWMPETSSFHMPWGEMTITLDDVSALLHIPVVGSFFSLGKPTKEEAAPVVVDLLGVTIEEVQDEFRRCRGPSLHYAWLLALVKNRVKELKWTEAARAYLLRLVGMTLFCDKSNTSVSVAYLELFRDISLAGQYAWGATALAYLYGQLGEACKKTGRTVAGYLTLLQAWVYARFPGSLFERKEFPQYKAGMPVARRWLAFRGTKKVDQKRLNLDNFPAGGVIWRPYMDHYVHRSFEHVSLYSGFIRFNGSVYPYLPERVSRQFGIVQSKPRAPPSKVSCEDCDAMWMDWRNHTIRGRYVDYPHECDTEYNDWYKQHSHPFMIPEELRVDRWSFLEGQFALLSTYSTVAVDPETVGAPTEGTTMWDVVHTMHSIIQKTLEGPEEPKQRRKKRSASGVGTSADYE